MVLSLVKSQDFHGCLLLFETGSSINNKIINITELGIKLGQEKYWTTHFTGCDSISVFKGKGKTKPFGLMLESEVFCSDCIALGSGWEIPDDILPDVEKFVCALYENKDAAGVNATSLQLISISIPI